ncbi:MAG: methyltransferase type 11 [Deltaproteobacteria bacterium CG11_big_fil_rev_8_21_14_0_20_45_16]|nr:MAG: methyltransferase type 11 [Deltaproteobacteria bacterium CG11_big_fil_rev_8_21_14_0_20_45_16]
MSFCEEWDVTYQQGSQMSVWPWSDLVSLVMRYARPLSKEFRVLELGCGAGANIRFFRELGVQYYGIEGSSHIVEQLKKRFPELENQLVAGDFTKELFFEGDFDLIVDRSSLTHNPTIDIRECLNMAFDKMKSGAKFIGIDWFSMEHSDRHKGRPVDDDYTYTDFSEGQFSGIGKVHFSDAEHLKDVFKRFNILHLEQKIYQRVIPKTELKFASWNLVAEKMS